MIATYSPRFRLVLASIFFVTLFAVMYLMQSTAHAQLVDQAPAVERVLVQAAPAIQATDPPAGTVAIVAAILGGLALVVTGLHAILAVIAPRTKTTVDDEVRDQLAALLEAIRGLPGIPAASSTTVNVAAPAPPEPTAFAAGRIDALGSKGSVLLVLLLGLALAVGCTKQQVASGVRAGMGCERPGLAAAAGELYAWAVDRIAAAIAGGQVDSAKLRAAMSNVVDASPRCAIESAIAAAATPPDAPRSSLAAGHRVDGAALRAEYERIKLQLWTAGG